MKNYLRYILIIICISFCACKVKKPSDNKYQLSLYSNKELLDNEKPNISVFLKVDTLQNESKAGLKFSIILRNDSTTSLTFGNLLDNLNFSLRPFPFKGSDEDVILNYTSRVRSHVSKIDFASSSIRIQDVKINGVSTYENISEETTVTIPANAEYEIILRIPRILQTNPSKPYNESQLITTPVGRYRLFLSQPIRLQNRYIRYNFIETYIQYGNKVKLP